MLTAGPVGGDRVREHWPAGLTNLVVAVHQDNAKVGGLEPASTLHDNVVALADVIDVHGDAGICPCDAQQSPGVPQPARQSSSDCGLPFTPTCHRPLVLSPSCCCQPALCQVHHVLLMHHLVNPRTILSVPGTYSHSTEAQRGEGTLPRSQSSFYLSLTYGVTSLASSVSILWHPCHSGARAQAP